VYTNRLVEGGVAFLEWTAEAEHTRATRRRRLVRHRRWLDCSPDDPLHRGGEVVLRREMTSWPRRPHERFVNPRP
jgi:hypothetical protein